MREFSKVKKEGFESMMTIHTNHAVQKKPKITTWYKLHHIMYAEDLDRMIF